MKRGFSLFEMLVVVGIIAILMSILLVSIGGSSDSARAATCLANMHTLASACHSIGMAENYYPPAGSWETASRASGSRTTTYSEVPGWISWASHGAYQPNNASTSAKGNASWLISTYFQPRNKAEIAWRHHALTNGAIWRAIGGNASAFVCPHHAKCSRKRKLEPLWSYCMNSAFGWAGAASPEPKRNQRKGLRFDSLENGDRMLLLAELPFDEENTSQKCLYRTTPGTELDPTLQYETGFLEMIGANHRSGKKWFAHVCFADGHAEKIEIPDGMSQNNLQELTTMLCEGLNVTRNGNKYEELK